MSTSINYYLEGNMAHVYFVTGDNPGRGEKEVHYGTIELF
jgi:hypothetical protein